MRVLAALLLLAAQPAQAMNPIVPPLKAGDRGDAVANLQDALILLLERAAIAVSDEERRALTASLQAERNAPPERPDKLQAREPAPPLYGPGTIRAITLFQQGHGLPATGEVDQPTATAINAAVAIVTQASGPKSCANGLVLISGKCQCPRGTTWSERLDRCVTQTAAPKSCPGNQVRVRGQCRCPSGTVWNNGRGRCDHSGQVKRDTWTGGKDKQWQETRGRDKFRPPQNLNIGPKIRIAPTQRR